MVHGKFVKQAVHPSYTTPGDFIGVAYFFFLHRLPGIIIKPTAAQAGEVCQPALVVFKSQASIEKTQGLQPAAISTRLRHPRRFETKQEQQRYTISLTGQMHWVC